MGNHFCRSKRRNNKDMDLENEIYLSGSLKYLELCGMDIEGKLRGDSRKLHFVRSPDYLK